MKPDVKLNRPGVSAVLKSQSVENAARARAERIARAAGPGYEASSTVGRNRARASVITGTYEARIDNQRRNTLLRSLGAK